jgi:predicted metal-binding membrane protein
VKPAAGTVLVRHRLTDRLLQPRPIQALQPPLTGLWIIIIGCAVVTAQDGLLGGDHQPGHRHLDNLSATRLLPAAVGWAVMLMAMMGPALMPAARHVALNTLDPRRTVPCFVLAYLSVWSAIAAAAGTGNLLIEQRISTSAAASQSGSFVVAGLIAAAAAWQLTPTKRACLRSCRAGGVLTAAGFRADRHALTFGLRHATACIGSCGPMMLIMLAGQGWYLAWMTLLGGIIWLEKARGLHRKLRLPTAAALATLAAATLIVAIITETPT